MVPSRPTLRPVQAPWFVSPSEADLSVRMDEASSLPTVVEFTGVFGKWLPTHARPGAWPAGRWIPAEQAGPLVRAAYHRVRVLFAGSWVHWGNHRDGRSPELDNYDRSSVPSVEPWAQGEPCPNPLMYEVEGSRWAAGLPSLGFESTSNQRHFLLMSKEAFVEVLAVAWEWQLGGPVYER